MPATAIKSVLTLAFPGHCRVCRARTHGPGLCRRCYRHLPWNRSACPGCADAVDCTGRYCERCREQGPPPGLTAVVCPWLYEPPLDRFITALKFEAALGVGRLLGQLLARQVKFHLLRSDRCPDALIATPLHRSRLRQRGYNQSMEIARPVASATGIPLIHGNLLRLRPTQAQSGLSSSARADNVDSAFHARLPARVAHVAVIDDVATTLATARAMAAALHAAGCPRVDLWAVCRTSTPG